MRTGGFVKRYMTVTDVARYFSFSKSYVYELIQRGKLEVFHPDGEIGSRGLRILSESVQRLEQSGRISPDEFVK